MSLSREKYQCAAKKTIFTLFSAGSIDDVMMLSIQELSMEHVMSVLQRKETFMFKICVSKLL